MSGSTSPEPLPAPARRFEAGDAVAPRELTTILGERIRVPDPEALVHLQFRRFAGCPICNVHLRSVAARHDEIVAAGIREVAVFHSSVEDMVPHQAALPFAAVADPGRTLYVALGVESSLWAVLHPRALLAGLRPAALSVVARGKRAGGRTGLARGETALGLPADFLLTPEGLVRAVHYGDHANDQWSVDELLALAAA
ncbi:peroxiredoxin [Saccharopolyspora lacisalsi]|uniref:Peroxiredoxin n=1 Tax=Halosaccharopolyspora lacisalsi TaxID=1000566 RepID=A0A839E2L7_9PSEU|nr:peroxiredoxin-like family protein [Halosaccharopolyspora lacisalsi]MBA8827523.1 peroxiredoxin [Halosaccharopolyspora lacisalsi]